MRVYFRVDEIMHYKSESPASTIPVPDPRLPLPSTLVTHGIIRYHNDAALATAALYQLSSISNALTLVTIVCNYCGVYDLARSPILAKKDEM
ncbi:unnamed protein product [Acanthocheilonema viteae]|uniref:Uncharacterized protein n=1 Tax=Acanthocheilonema viteae TaxID=6277 RepID=A0A498SCS0_ACAVI|nr:unnamed protein product [Acanthocheilonema viteae]